MNHLEATAQEWDQHINKMESMPEETRCFGCINAHPINDLTPIGNEYYCNDCINHE